MPTTHREGSNLHGRDNQFSQTVLTYTHAPWYAFAHARAHTHTHTHTHTERERETERLRDRETDTDSQHCKKILNPDVVVLFVILGCVWRTAMNSWLY
jgi:hypothetical protein